MNPKDPKWAHDGPKMVHSASGPQLQRRKPPAALPSLGQSASARELPLPIKQPKARRFKASSRLETLNNYVATSGCYEVIDDMLQTVLLERPTSMLPFLVQYARGCDHKAKRAQVEVKLEQGKVLSVEEMELLRGDAEPEPVPDEAFALLELVDPIDHKLMSGHLLTTEEVAILTRRAEGAHCGAAGRRVLWADYLSSQQVNAMLQTLALELLQSQPASPYGFATHWLEVKMEAKVEVARVEKAAAEVRAAAAAEAEAARLEQARMARMAYASACTSVVTSATATPRFEVDLGSRPGPREGRRGRVHFGHGQSSEDPLERKLRLGHMLSADEVEELTRRAAEAEEMEDPLERKLRLGHMLTDEEVQELTLRAVAEEEEEEEGEEDPLERKLRLGHMLTEEEVQELTRRAAEAEGGEEDPLEQKLRLGHMLTEDEVQELTRRAAEAEGGSEDPLERKLRLGHILTDEEVQELTRRAAEQAEGGEDSLERKMRLGQLLDDEEVEELKRRAVAEEIATDVAAGVMDEAVEAVVRSTTEAGLTTSSTAPGSLV